MEDIHSFARPQEARIEHLALDLKVDFAARTLAGTARLDIANPGAVPTLMLDAHGLDISRVTLDDGSETTFALGPEVPFLGQALAVTIAPTTRRVTLEYSSRPDAEAVQWLEPSQTAGGKHPFLFTQSQAILARTWIPLQDTPSVRFTYEARIQVPPDLLAVMSAENPTARNADGIYTFRMPQAIPSYLMALAVGDLEFRALDERSGVYAEPGVVQGAAAEFVDIPAMIDATEKLYGPYRWGRYDVLVLPPSFPFGGMENPRLTFATPTILAGDRSLVALIAHELAHSWSGNLVTNATWNDFWLNEGFTVYLERRIMEALEGRDHAEMLAQLGLGDLRDTIEELGPVSPDTHLRLTLEGRNPDDGMSDIAYEKGAYLLRTLEAAVGRERWDPFLRSWFDGHAFESNTTESFLAYLEQHLPGAAEQVNAAAWVYGPGLPANANLPQSAALVNVEAAAKSWTAGAAASSLSTAEWSTQEWLHFLRSLPEALPAERMAELDRTFRFSESGNSEILAEWLGAAIRNRYAAAYPALEKFLVGMGRRKFLTPLYGAMAKTPEGKEMALRIYRQARPGYHAVSRGTIDGLLGWQEGG